MEKPAHIYCIQAHGREVRSSVEQMWKGKYSPLTGLTGPLRAQSRAAGSQAVKCFHDFLQRGAPPALVSICQVKGGQRVREGRGGQVHYSHGRAGHDSPWPKGTRFCLLWHRRCFLGNQATSFGNLVVHSPVFKLWPP